MEVLVYACFAEGAEAFIDSVSIAEEPSANWALEQWVEGLLLDLLDMWWQRSDQVLVFEQTNRALSSTCDLEMIIDLIFAFYYTLFNSRFSLLRLPREIWISYLNLLFSKVL